MPPQMVYNLWMPEHVGTGGQYNKKEPNIVKYKKKENTTTTTTYRDEH